VALVRTDVSEERIGSIIRVTKNRRAMKNVTSNRQPQHAEKAYPLRLLVFPSSPFLLNLMIEDVYSSEMSVLRSSTQSHIPEDGILH
jgi:hypothetical protein